MQGVWNNSFIFSQMSLLKKKSIKQEWDVSVSLLYVLKLCFSEEMLKDWTVTVLIIAKPLNYRHMWSEQLHMVIFQRGLL